MLKTAAQIQEEVDAKLAPYATKNSESKGRLHEEKHDDYRLPFQRDRDRIIHSKAFRRLQAKTQVFMASFGDHYRDRLTHSIEVSQISRDIARRLSLNEDLCEAIALAHDLGHPPFGHGGEQALNDLMKPFGLAFEHNLQSRRIVEKLERMYPHWDGLNPTYELLDGLFKHGPPSSAQTTQPHFTFLFTPHLETQIVDMADEIAYINHDIDDALRAGLITIPQLQQFDLWQQAEQQIKEEYSTTPNERLISRIISTIISTMIEDLQQNTWANIQKYNIDSIEKIRSHKDKIADFSPEMCEKIAPLRSFLFKNFYSHPTVTKAVDHGQKIIKKLFHHYHQHPQALPEPYAQLIANGEPLEVVVKDYIAGMTDHYAEEKYRELP